MNKGNVRASENFKEDNMFQADDERKKDRH